MLKDRTQNINGEKRSIARPANLKNYRIEIKFVGEPIYQFKAINVTTNGAGILIKDDSAFLNMIEVGQIIKVNFLSPQGSNPSGMYKAKIRHITNTEKQEYRGHLFVGISIINELDENINS